MNERLKELEKQSYTEVMHEMGGTYMAFDKEKFAELIVQNCIDYCGENLSTTVGGALKIHFGVE
jgi:hypothetical protein